MISELKKKIGLTTNFLNRKKKNKFSIVGFIRYIFRNYNKAEEAEYNPRVKRYLKVQK